MTYPPALKNNRQKKSTNTASVAALAITAVIAIATACVPRTGTPQYIPTASQPTASAPLPTVEPAEPLTAIRYSGIIGVDIIRKDPTPQPSAPLPETVAPFYTMSELGKAYPELASADIIDITPLSKQFPGLKNFETSISYNGGKGDTARFCVIITAINANNQRVLIQTEIFTFNHTTYTSRYPLMMQIDEATGTLQPYTRDASFSVTPISSIAAIQAHFTGEAMQVISDYDPATGNYRTAQDGQWVTANPDSKYTFDETTSTWIETALLQPVIDQDFRKYIQASQGTLSLVDGEWQCVVSYHGKDYTTLTYDTESKAWVADYSIMAAFYNLGDGTYQLEAAKKLTPPVRVIVSGTGDATTRSFNQVDYTAYKAAVEAIYHRIQPTLPSEDNGYHVRFSNNINPDPLKGKTITISDNVEDNKSMTLIAATTIPGELPGVVATIHLPGLGLIDIFYYDHIDYLGSDKLQTEDAMEQIANQTVDPATYQYILFNLGNQLNPKFFEGREIDQKVLELILQHNRAAQAAYDKVKYTNDPNDWAEYITALRALNIPLPVIKIRNNKPK